MDYNIQCKAALLEIVFESEESEDDYLNLITYSSSSDDEDEIVKNLYTVLDKNRKKLNKKPQVEGFVELFQDIRQKNSKHIFGTLYSF